MKVDGRNGKLILKRILSDFVPEKLFNRPKAGFAVPIAAWLRGPLRVGPNHLDEKLINEDGFFDFCEVMKMWNKHVSGSQDMSNELWSILMFQAWRLDQ